MAWILYSTGRFLPMKQELSRVLPSSIVSHITPKIVPGYWGILKTSIGYCSEDYSEQEKRLEIRNTTFAWAKKSLALKIPPYSFLIQIYSTIIWDSTHGNHGLVTGIQPLHILARGCLMSTNIHNHAARCSHWTMAELTTLERPAALMPPDIHL